MGLAQGKPVGFAFADNFISSEDGFGRDWPKCMKDTEYAWYSVSVYYQHTEHSAEGEAENSQAKGDVYKRQSFKARKGVSNDEAIWISDNHREPVWLHLQGRYGGWT